VIHLLLLLQYLLLMLNADHTGGHPPSMCFLILLAFEDGLIVGVNNGDCGHSNGATTFQMGHLFLEEMENMWTSGHWKWPIAQLVMGKLT
jgi:hypothetical protein